MNNTTVSSGYSTMFARLERIPVRHACGHFELRLTRWNDSDPSIGYLQAQSPCSSCAPQGRPVQPNYATLAEAQTEARENPR